MAGTVRRALHKTPGAIGWALSATALGLVVVAAAVSACTSGSSLRTLEIETSSGATETLRVEIADAREERARGLSGRQSLDRDRGMLFVIEERSAGFWMRDVPFPLSIAFIDGCGVILEVQEMEPQSLDLHTIEQPYSYALEANGGWFDEHGVDRGDEVSLPEEYRRITCPA